MLGSSERRAEDARRARDVLARRGALLPDGSSSPEILDSWARCFDAGLDCFARPELIVLGDAALRQRREQAGRVRELALIEIEALFHQIAGSNFLLAFADPDSVVLDVCADNRFATSSSGEAILPSSQWREAVTGTNGLGTALATGCSVAVNGPEHFFASLGGISCTASPIRDAEGAIVGAIDASSYFESRQRHTQALVQMAATHVENVLLAEQRAGEVVLAIHPRPEFLGTLSAGLLAFDGEGRASAFNARARILLSGLDLRRGARFEALFEEPWERFLARLQAGADAPLRDVLGSALHARWINRRGLHRGPGVPSAKAPVTPPPALPGPVPNFVADDAAVRTAVSMVVAAVGRGLPILIHGETGSGKELMARHAHEASGRRGAFVAVNCGALSAELIEAELFGYVGGAYTGARRDGNAGLLASADGGTLLLDEVRELPPALQPVLLRFLDDHLVRPIGGQKSRRIDVQLLAATNADLEQEVAARRFRADLLYRLNTIRVDLPPLRERSDFGAIVGFVLQQIDPAAAITPAALAELATHPWPGNFRELRSVLTRALLLRPTRLLELADVRPVLPVLPAGRADAVRSLDSGSALRQAATETVLHDFERTGSVSQTSRNLNISRTTVYRHLREAGIEPVSFHRNSAHKEIPHEPT